MWKLLRHRLHYRLQRPARRAVERDEAAIVRWVTEDWPRICRNARRRRAVIMFGDESGASLLPVTRRTWAPVSHTPVIRQLCKWKRASMAAAICERLPGYAPDLNPVEGLWANLKGIELANLAADTPGGGHRRGRAWHPTHLQQPLGAFSFLRQCGLSVW